MKIIALPFAFVLLVTLPASTFAQARSAPSKPAPDTAVVRVSGGAIDSALRSLAASKSSADIARDLPAGDLARYQLVVLSRRIAGLVELHERWTDIVFVRSGSAVLRTGRTLAGQRAKGQGEYTAEAIVRGRDQAVGPGDVVVIPAALAHQWRPTGAQGFSYVVLKMHPAQVPAAAAPAP